ncbi:hypothetical protein GCM10023144_42730 [Pigmentiphaga soli]|uniref:Uncharacterized protein n=1 Tax=Pigmentiphaga soli TaxID=1007095 RepID=A0ABP8HN41_9BURK
MALPLAEIVTLANMLVDVSGRLYETYRKRKRQPLPDLQAGADTQLAALHEHVQQLEAAQEKQAELAMQLSEQLQELSVALARQARIARAAIWLAGLALAAGATALAAAWPA